MARALGADLGNSRTIQSLGNGHYEDSETTKVASQFAVHAVETADGISKLRELNDFTYPTRSSRFLGRMKLDTQNQSNDTYTAKASVPLKIIIAGAGLGGLATAIGLARTGHLVQVFEQAPALGEVGAGIQVPSNSTRILLKWGLAAHLAAHVVEPESINFRRWEDGSIIGLTKLIPDFRHSFDAPYYVVHRAHFHSAMYELAKELGVKVILGAKICNYHPESPALELENGQIHKGDLVIAADGAAMAVEDAAALAAILAEVKSREEIHDALKVFERVRILRSGQMQGASLTNGKLWHYADGPEQKARDSAMRPEVLGEHFIESPNQWSDPLTQAWCYGYDAEEEVLREWRSIQGSG